MRKDGRTEAGNNQKKKSFIPYIHVQDISSILDAEITCIFIVLEISTNLNYTKEERMREEILKSERFLGSVVHVHKTEENVNSFPKSEQKKMCGKNSFIFLVEF